MDQRGCPATVLAAWLAAVRGLTARALSGRRRAIGTSLIKATIIWGCGLRGPLLIETVLSSSLISLGFTAHEIRRSQHLALHFALEHTWRAE
jgi:hypothetical protein